MAFRLPFLLGQHRKRTLFAPKLYGYCVRNCDSVSD
nr:MAG TPA: hypothetical protein [Caudoviricetes sp.]